MGILEVHFHDSEFSWSMNPGTDDERTFSLGSRSESKSGESGTTDSGTDRLSLAPKLRSFAVLALVIAGGVAFRRMRSRRAREAAEREESSRRFPRIRSR